MIINFYLPDSDQNLLEQIRKISETRRRSVSFVVREALEKYCLTVAKRFRPKSPTRRASREPKADE